MKSKKTLALAAALVLAASGAVLAEGMKDSKAGATTNNSTTNANDEASSKPMTAKPTKSEATGAGTSMGKTGPMTNGATNANDEAVSKKTK
jgi:hypothetical protein